MLGKDELLEAIAGKNRGLLATETDKQAILAAIARLEDRNPTPQPTAAVDLLAGDWKLLYTTSRELLGLDRFPLVKLGQIYQCIRPQQARIYNVAEFSGLPLLEGIVSVAANFNVISDRRVKVNFERGVLGLQRLVGYNSLAEFIPKLEANMATKKRFWAIDFDITAREQRGWLDVTYLDQDLRIGRGNEGSVFVLTRG